MIRVPVSVWPLTRTQKQSPSSVVGLGWKGRNCKPGWHCKQLLQPKSPYRVTAEDPVRAITETVMSTTDNQHLPFSLSFTQRTQTVEETFLWGFGIIISTLRPDEAGRTSKMTPQIYSDPPRIGNCNKLSTCTQNILPSSDDWPTSHKAGPEIPLFTVEMKSETLGRRKNLFPGWL